MPESIEYGRTIAIAPTSPNTTAAAGSVSLFNSTGAGSYYGVRFELFTEADASSGGANFSRIKLGM